jgi:FtsP/CotA-like multicopper oxidase with cupredoxin domain
MNTIVKAKGGLIVGILAVLLLVGFSAAPVQAVVDGIEGNTFDLVARQDYISSPDGDSILMWGYANGGNPMQYPGPTLIVQQGETITINLTNELPAAHGQNVSIVFPGQVVTASGGVAGALTNEVEPGGAAVTYTFEATHPGTFMYKSGTRPDLQVEMGLVGAIVVRSAMPSVVDPRPYTEQIHVAPRDVLFRRPAIWRPMSTVMRCMRPLRRGSQNPRCMPRCGLPRKSNRNSIVANDDNYALAA